MSCPVRDGFAKVVTTFRDASVDEQRLMLENSNIYIYQALL